MSRKVSEIATKSAESVALRDYVFLFKGKELRGPDGKTVILRNQSADVLCVLAAHAGEIVSKDELAEAVWGDTFVTDDSLVQCIADIRRAVGDTRHEIIETFAKRGYRLNADSTSCQVSRAEADATRPHRSFLRQSAAAVFAAAAAIVVVLVAINLGGETLRIGPDVSGTPRIAVLPFDDLSVGDDKGYLSDAISEGIITELSRSKTYSVIARNSTIRYRKRPTDIRRIGAELAVDYVLDGSQQKSADHVKVTARLIDAHDGTHLWSQTYDRRLGDLFVVQEEIIRTLADRVGRRIERPLPESDVARVSALHYYLLGIAAIRGDFSEKGTESLRQMSLKAVKADPSSQFGYIGLAWSYRNDAVFGWHQQEHGRDDALRLAASYADKALDLAPDDADAHHVRARIHVEAGEVKAALARFDRAIALNPSDSSAIVGSTDLLLYIGRTDEAIDRIRKAEGIDPFFPEWFHWQMGWALWEKHDCRGALDEMLEMTKIPTGAQRMLAGIYACLGRAREAHKALEVYLASSPGQTISSERREWAKIWTAPGSLDRWIEEMRIAGMPE